MPTQKVSSAARVEAALAASKSTIRRVVSRLRTSKAKREELENYLLSQLGFKMAKNPDLADQFVQSQAILARAILNLTATYFRAQKRREMREAPLSDEAVGPCREFEEHEFLLFLHENLMPETYRYACLKILGLSDKDVTARTREQRRAIEKHRGAIALLMQSLIQRE